MWSLDDEKIIGASSTSCPVFLAHSDLLDASKSTWTSDAYEHYNFSLRLDTGTSESGASEAPNTLVFVLSCKHGHPSYRPIERARGKSSHGTTQLLKTARECDTARGLVIAQRSTAPEYSPAARRAIIPMRTATSNQPFNFVEDKYYKMEVELLRPGIIIPSPAQSPEFSNCCMSSFRRT